MTLKTAKKRIKQLERDVIDLQFRFENLDERVSNLFVMYGWVDTYAKAHAPYIPDPSTIPMGGGNVTTT